MLFPDSIEVQGYVELFERPNIPQVKFYDWKVAHNASKEVSVLSVQPTFPN